MSEFLGRYTASSPLFTKQRGGRGVNNGKPGSVGQENLMQVLYYTVFQVFQAGAV